MLRREPARSAPEGAARRCANPKGRKRPSATLPYLQNIVREMCLPRPQTVFGVPCAEQNPSYGYSCSPPPDARGKSMAARKGLTGHTRLTGHLTSANPEQSNGSTVLFILSVLFVVCVLCEPKSRGKSAAKLPKKHPCQSSHRPSAARRRQRTQPATASFWGGGLADWG